MVRLCRYALPELMWLGVLKRWVDDYCGEDDMQPLNPGDYSKLNNLIRLDDRIPNTWKVELSQMEDARVKCEIETVCKRMGVEAFCKMIVDFMAMYIAI